MTHEKQFEEVLSHPHNSQLHQQKNSITRRGKKLLKVLISFDYSCVTFLQRVVSSWKGNEMPSWSLWSRKKFSSALSCFLCDDIPLNIIPGINSFVMRWRIENTHERWCKVLLVSSHNARSMIPFIEWFFKKASMKNYLIYFPSIHPVRALQTAAAARKRSG